MNLSQQQAKNAADLLNKLNGFNGHKNLEILREQLGVNKPKLVVVK